MNSSPKNENLVFIYSPSNFGLFLTLSYCLSSEDLEYSYSHTFKIYQCFFVHQG